jgi:hypothetical protein
MPTPVKLNSLFLMTGIVFFSLISVLAVIKLFKVLKKIWKELDREEKEGFADTDAVDEKKKTLNPDEISYHMLKNAMVSIRKVTKHILDPKVFMERISMARMSPTELARRYIAETTAKNAAENKNKE